jgi:hypothetical protein
MNKSIAPEVRELMEVVHYRPAVSIILPFEPKMGLRHELDYSLKIAAAKVQAEITASYPPETVSLVMQKLMNCIKNLNFNTHKKSIAIFVSPVFEKVLYLDVAVEEKIIVDESFEIRDLVFSKKEIHKYLILLLSAKNSRIYLGNTESFVRIVSSSRIYLGNTESFVRIVSSTPESVHAYVNEVPERVANFSDISDRKEVILDKFLYHIDNSLDIILNAYRLPLFVLGTERITGHFKAITKHGSSVIDYVHGNYEEQSPEALRKILQPHIADWKKVKQKDLLNQLEDAAGKKKLAVGMQEVWKEAMHNRGKLLVVEKNFMYAAEHGAAEDEIHKIIPPYNKYSYIKDAVDDAIEKVLENGGDVEFTEQHILDSYGHIALIKYY